MSRRRDRHRSATFGATTPFAVECPGCHAHVAVPRSLVGRAAGCPACRSAFLVPPAEREEPPLPESFERPKRKRRTIVLPDPAPERSAPEPSATEASGFPDPAVTERAQVAPAPVRTSRPAASPPRQDFSRDEPPRHDEPLVFAEPPPPSTRGRDRSSVDPNSAAGSAAAVVGATVPTAATVTPRAPGAGPEDQRLEAASDSGGLAFRDPVKTVRSGGAEIELRRLTPEERRVRRARRNLLFLVVGAALLVALVMLLGQRGR